MTGPLAGDVTLGETLRLRLTLVIRDLHMKDERPLVIPVKESRSLEVTFRRPNPNDLANEDTEASLTLGDTVCVVGGAWSVSKANREALLKLAREGGQELTQRLVVFGALSGSGMPAWDALPDSLKQMLDAGFHELARAVRRTFRLMRWRWQLPAEADPFRILSFSWSPDATRWQDIPWRMPLLVAKVVPTLSSSEGAAEEIATAIGNGEDEPIAHELLREARDLVEQSPRAALIMAISAAEIGFKQFIGRRVPPASWLVMESPTPPLLTMLTQYFPELLEDLGLLRDLRFVDGKTDRRYNDPVLRELERGISMRNRFVHKPVANPPNPDGVTCVIDAVQDLLGMLDHYSGAAPFGRQFIRPQVRAAWFDPGAKMGAR